MSLTIRSTMNNQAAVQGKNYGAAKEQAVRVMRGF